MSSPDNTSDDSQSQASASTSSSYPFSDEFPQLLDKHLDHLKASAISIDVIKERGYESVLGKKRLADLGFSKAQQRTPGLLCPGWGVDGQQIGCQYRPDHPRVDGRDRTIKYETPKGASNRVDCPPRCQKQSADPSIPLYVTEGAKKGDCLATQGLCVIDISGIWNWKSKNELKGVTISADFDYIALNDRKVYLVPDSDIATIPGVKQACSRLAEHLRRKKASVNIVYLPQEGTKKVGVDDFIVAGHTIEEILALAIPLEEVPEEEEKEKEIYASHAYYNKNLYLEIRRFDGSYCFAFLKGNEVGLVPEIVAGDITLRPRPLPVSEGRTIPFVGMPDGNIMTAKILPPGKLYKEIEAHFHKYIDLPDLDLQLCIYYDLFTWFYRKVNTLGYLRFLADTGKGKSRILQVVGDLCFYPVSASGASSFSGIARQQDKWRGTLVTDESDFQGDKEAQFTKYLNLGFEKGKPYVLSDKQNPKNQEFFDPFSPKILAMREPFGDPATEGRMLSISPHETTDAAIPIILRSNYWVEMQALRNKVARFVLEHWEQIEGEEMLDFHNLGVEPRLQQLAMPMSIIFQLWPEGAGQFKQYLLARQLEIRKHRAQSWQGGLFNLVYSIAVDDLDLQEEFASFYEPESKEIQVVTPSMVAKQMKSSAKSVTKGLIGIGFEVEQKWITSHSKDADSEIKEKRKQTRAYVVPSQRAWDEMLSRYYYQEDEEGGDVELPDILRSKKFVYEKKSVYVEASHPSQVSQKEEAKKNARDSCDTCDGSTHTVNKKDDKKAISPATFRLSDGRVADWLWCLSTWNKIGRPVVYAGDNDNIFDLSLFLYPEKLSPKRLEGIVNWLEEHSAEKMPELENHESKLPARSQV